MKRLKIIPPGGRAALHRVGDPRGSLTKTIRSPADAQYPWTGGVLEGGGHGTSDIRKQWIYTYIYLWILYMNGRKKY